MSPVCKRGLACTLPNKRSHLGDPGTKSKSGQVNGLFSVRQCADVRFQRLVVLALDLQLGLKFFDHQLEVRDLRAKLALDR